jgi:fatty acid amide hydrolase 2
LHPLYKPAHFVYTGIINVMELPATQVPLGLSEELLPLGVQVIARHGQDHLGLAVARELEEIFGGWIPPWRASAS